MKPTATTSYRAVWDGATIADVTYPPASASVRVQVKPKVTLALTRYNRRSGKYFLYKAGRTVYAKGAVAPNHAKLGDGTTAGKVTVTAYQYKSRKWVKVQERRADARARRAPTPGPGGRGTRARTAGRRASPATWTTPRPSVPFRYVKIY